MKKLVGMVAGACVDDEWWCISRILNGLYKFNLSTEQVEYICDLPEKNELDKQAYTDVILCGKELYFIPAFAKNVAIYDIEQGKFTEINILKYMAEGDKGFNIAGGAVYGEWLCLYPCLASSIIRINIKTKMIDTNNFYIETTGIKKDIFAYHKRHFQSDSGLYIALASYDGVLYIDIEKFEFYIIDIPNDGTGYSAIVKIEDDLWLAPNKEGAIVKYNIVNKRNEKIKEYPPKFRRNNDLAFSDFMYFGDDNLYLLPFAANMFIRIDKKQETMYKLELNFSEAWLLSVMDDITSINIHSSKRQGEKYYLFSESLNRMLIFDQDEKMDEKQFLLKICDKIGEKTINAKESRGFGLSDFLKYLSI